MLPEGLTTAEIDKLPSRRFTGFDWSEHPAVVALIDELFDEYLIWAKEVDGQQRINKEKELKEHLTCFVLEAFRTHNSNPNVAMSVSLGNETISNYQDNIYRPKHISFRLINHIYQFLSQEQFIYLPLGEMGRATGATSHYRSTRVMITDTLLKRIKHYKINRFMITTFPTPPQIIILRKRKCKGETTGELEEYKDTDQIKLLRGRLKLTNDFIDKHLINLEITDEQEDELAARMSKRENDDAKPSGIDFTNKSLRRVFNNSSFEQGGRLYGGFWQHIFKEYRGFITINDKRTIQLDYSGMHFNIMYTKKGLPTPEDPYQLDGYDTSLRADIKQGFNTIVNCGTEKQAIGAIDKAIRDGELEAGIDNGEKLLTEFKAKHPDIVEYIASGEGVKLQFIDSEIAQKVLLKGRLAKVCILPIHDGFITNTGNEACLRSWMNEAFAQIVGGEIEVKTESIYLELITGSESAETFLVTNDDGSLVKNQEVLSGKAKSYSAIRSVESIVETLGKTSRYEIRRAEWLAARGIDKCRWMER